MRATSSLAGIAIALLVVAACRDVDPTAPRILKAPGGMASVLALPEGTAYSPVLDELNRSLVAAGVTHVAIGSAEISVAYGVEGWNGATTLIANNRTHTVATQFVPSDPRRGGSSSVSYLVDESEGLALTITARHPITGAPTAAAALPAAITGAEIQKSMEFWASQPSCGAPEVSRVADNGSDPDLFDALILETPALLGTPRADITHAGWLAPTPFFAKIAPGGQNFILGVTVTFVFTNPDGTATDIDGDHRADVAFREIYYNRGFGWTPNNPDPMSNVDLQSVIIHEAGHAYGLGHFGMLFVDTRGFLKYAPRAIMNAAYSGPFRQLTGADNSSFCQVWASAN